MREIIDLQAYGVRYLSLRRVGIDGATQALTIQTNHGSVTINLIPAAKNEDVRILDYRDRPKNRGRRSRAALDAHQPQPHKITT